MEMLDFWCPSNGLEHNNCILIKIPKICCGKKTEIANYHLGSNRYPTVFDECCNKHLGSYKNIWIEYYSNWKFIFNTGPSKISKPSACGHICSCGYFNEYAEANQSDGSYKCFNCR